MVTTTSFGENRRNAICNAESNVYSLGFLDSDDLQGFFPPRYPRTLKFGTLPFCADPHSMVSGSWFTSCMFYREVHNLLDRMVADTHLLRSTMALTDTESDRGRRDRAEFTSNKLQILGLVRYELGDLPLPSGFVPTAYLTGKKSISLSTLPLSPDANRVTGNTISSNAGTQLETRENEPSAIADAVTRTVQPLPQAQTVLTSVPLSNWTIEELRFYSELLLTELENRGTGDTWSVTHSGVGEGDDLLSFQ
jgi:hypothetical protein